MFIVDCVYFHDHWIFIINYVKMHSQKGLVNMAESPTISSANNQSLEYLRSYILMQDFYNKLIVLNYQNDFCETYKCPTIDKYYFSSQNQNSSEQMFIFVSLCAWLIKDKCQMNLSLEPDNYEDLDVTLSIISEAVKLLITYIDEEGNVSSDTNDIGFSLGRLKQGFGPEVLFVLNVLSDRAIELMSDGHLASFKNDENNEEIDEIIKFVQSGNVNNNQTNKSQQANSFITIGQPIVDTVGGGLTSRPLGSYELIDESLSFDKTSPITDDTIDSKKANDEHSISSQDKRVAAGKWYAHVNDMSSQLEQAGAASQANNLLRRSSFDLTLATPTSTISLFQSKANFAELLKSTLSAVETFETETMPILSAVNVSIKRDMRQIEEREQYLMATIKDPIDKFISVYKECNKKLTIDNAKLKEQASMTSAELDIESKKMDEMIRLTKGRRRELADGSKLKELELKIGKLKEENEEFDAQIGILLAVLATDGS